MKRFVILSALVVAATSVAEAQVREPARADSTLAALVAEPGTNNPEIAGLATGTPLAATQRQAGGGR